MASSEDEVLGSPGGLEDDLFGSDDEAPEKIRELSDRELDSGDDENRDDRAPKPEVEAEQEERDANILDSTIWRHPLPKPADGEVRCSVST
jgi:RNA polymerase-associated protein LEO1